MKLLWFIPTHGDSRYLGTTRGALYKTLDDARRKLRARLTAEGHLDDAPTMGGAT